MQFLKYTLIFLVVVSCSNQQNTRVTVPLEFSEYISGYTSGQISAEGEIAVTLAQPVGENNQTDEGLFRFDPSVVGETEWVNSTTVVFKPEQKLENGQDYTVLFRMGRLFEVDEDRSEFTFNVSTIGQDIELQFGSLETQPQNRNEQRLTGTVHTADVAELQSVREILQARHAGSSLKIDWEQDGAKRTHRFQINDIQRQQEETKLVLSWNGAPIGVDLNGEKTFDIIPIGAFELMDVMVFRDENPRVELTFSDPLDPRQNLNGLITIENSTNLNFIINENKITVNPRQRRDGVQNLRIDPAVRNTDGKRLGMEITRQVQFYQPKPQVELLGKGTIIPRSKNLLFPFKAVSLGAVDVRVVRIFENNIGQFLQDYDLGNSSAWNIEKVGRPVFGGVVPLSRLGSVDAGEWNNYALDLSKLITPEPGALYQVEIGFRDIHSIYPCGETSAANAETDNWEYEGQEEQEYWDNYSSRGYPEGFNWRERENPCHVSYYTSDIRTSRNVLASDLGMIAKKADEENITAFVTDLLTAKPKSGVEVRAFDYQQQQITSGSTDAEGKVTLETSRTPFYLTASVDGQKGYLKVNDGNALSLSDFDVSGARIQKGIKGFLYGERGVWRPGDSLFVTLILEDENNVLPDDHPVTFELKNPSGQLEDKQTFTSGLNGFYVYQVQTEKQAPTGNWQLQAKVGGLTFSKQLKIESVKPNRLKVEVDFAEDKVTAETRQLQATLNSRWLHGAVAGNMKADVEMSLRPAAVSFSDYPAYSFEDASVSFSSSPVTIFEGNLNGQGTADFSHSFNRLSEGPARILVNLRTRVFEPSGNFSIGRANTYYYPFRTLIGIKPPAMDEGDYWDWLDPDESHRFEVASLDVEGNPVAGKELDIEVYNIRWRWWWERGTEDLSSYFERENINVVLSGKVSTDEEGKGIVNLKLPEGSDGGRYLVRVKDPQGGHSASSIVYFSWYGGRSESVSPARLTFSSDKDSYEVGEDISITIPSSQGSRILVSMESGSKVLDTFWLDGKAGETVFSIPADENMTPNVYAHVMHLQPHGQQSNDLPLRMYGVIPISVEDPNTKLAPVVELPGELRPESSVQVNVSEQNGKAMTYTIAMVDEGLLDLTNFSTPEPHDHFYAREALGVNTWDMYQFVSDAYAGNLSRIIAIGGDGEAGQADPLEEANRFEPMVRFEGPFLLKEGTVNRHDISVPNYVGSVRTMVIAGQDGAYGQTQATTPVRKPVMVLATLPRVLGPGETVKLPVSVFAMNERVRNVQVRVEANDIFEINGEASTTLNFEEPGDQVITFELETKSQIGVGNVRVEATGGGESAYHEIEIAVRNPNSPFVDVRSEIIEEGESWTESFEAQGMTGTNSAMLEVSRIPPIDFGKRLQYLTRFPHGCIEQTTSAVFPQLYVSKVMDLPDGKKADIQNNVEGGIERMQKFLTFSGGLAYWPGNEDPNSWGTNYGYHFLLEAKNEGYYVPSDLLDKITRFQKERARNWREDQDYRRSDLIQAYRLYTLALANMPELGAMNRLREKEGLSIQSKWRLAAAYALAGQKEAAENLITGMSTSVENYRELSNSYGSSLRDRAMILETLSILDRQDEAALIVRDISAELSSQQWMSTQTTAYSLIAISKFLNKFTAAEEMLADFSINGEEIGSIDSRAIIVQTPVRMDEFNTNNFELVNNSEGTLYARLILEGTPLIGDTISSSNSLVQKVRFTNLDGETIDPAVLTQGTDFVAEVTVTNPGLRGDYEELALSQVFPSGWEIRNTRMDDESFSEPVSSFDYQDIRDDRVYTYFDLAPNTSKIFRVQLNAAYAGEFYFPAVNTAAMYDETISARSAGKWIQVQTP
ncbi:MAG TPA: MG2 domain-containing protein [Gracilimonas sp.]|uniref:alpha-2-macroglobulin family protein n=1 Tax=Gracilimonas sp. TaxID=1974203 RepID=UPI002D9A4271|nr:MG2 domain-containing protein [Gracilimonas sp.]